MRWFLTWCLGALLGMATGIAVPQEGDELEKARAKHLEKAIFGELKAKDVRPDLNDEQLHQLNNELYLAILEAEGQELADRMVASGAINEPTRWFGKGWTITRATQQAFSRAVQCDREGHFKVVGVFGDKDGVTVMVMRR